MNIDIIIGAVILAMAVILSTFVINIAVIDPDSLDNLSLNFNMNEVVVNNITIGENIKTNNGSIGYTGVCENVTVRQGIIIGCG